MDDELELDSDESTEEEYDEEVEEEDEQEDPAEESDDELDDPAEAERGALRMADYTRKTQALARDREQVAAEKAQLQQAWAQLQAQYQRPEPQYDEDEIDPRDLKLMHVERQLGEVSLAMKGQMYQYQANNLANMYGLPNGDALLDFAVRNGSRETGPLPLEVAAELMETRLKREARQASTEKVRQAKRATPPIESGVSRSPASRGKGRLDPLESLDAFEVAWRAAGGT